MACRPLHHGMLNVVRKRGSGLYYFQLWEDRLEYFANEEGAQNNNPRGQLCLTDIEEVEVSEQRMTFKLPGGRQLELTSSDDLQPWTSAFEPLLNVKFEVCCVLTLHVSELLDGTHLGVECYTLSGESVASLQVGPKDTLVKVRAAIAKSIEPRGRPRLTLPDARELSLNDDECLFCTLVGMELQVPGTPDRTVGSPLVDNSAMADVAIKVDAVGKSPEIIARSQDVLAGELDVVPKSRNKHPGARRHCCPTFCLKRWTKMGGTE